MKTRFLTFVVLVLLATGLGSYSTMFVVAECVPTACDPNQVPFPFDPNLVVYRFLGSLQGREGRPLVRDLGVCDPDGDAVVVSLISGPSGASVQSEDGFWRLRWTPTAIQVGVFAIHIRAIDIPPLNDQPLEDRGTILIRILKTNRPPVFRSMCGG